MQSTPDFKKRLMEALIKVSTDKAFILIVSDSVGENEEDANKVIDYIRMKKDVSRSDIIELAMSLYLERQLQEDDGDLIIDDFNMISKNVKIKKKPLGGSKP